VRSRRGSRSSDIRRTCPSHRSCLWYVSTPASVSAAFARAKYQLVDTAAIVANEACHSPVESGEMCVTGMRLCIASRKKNTGGAQACRLPGCAPSDGHCGKTHGVEQRPRAGHGLLRSPLWRSSGAVLGTGLRARWSSCLRWHGLPCAPGVGRAAAWQRRLAATRIRNGHACPLSTDNSPILQSILIHVLRCSLQLAACPACSLDGRVTP
jgi:hypothetical protein